jgi:hypothetical protein
MAIYYLTRWMASSGKKVRLVELGPGRGTLMDDMLRVSQCFYKVYLISVFTGSSQVREGGPWMTEIDDSDIIRIPNNIQ